MTNDDFIEMLRAGGYTARFNFTDGTTVNTPATELFEIIAKLPEPATPALVAARSRRGYSEEDQE